MAADLLADAAFLFGWKPDEVLKMRASLFFRVLNRGRVVYSRERNSFIAELCDVATVTLNQENHKIFSAHYREKAFGKRKVRALDLSDEKTAHIIASAFWASSPLRRH